MNRNSTSENILNSLWKIFCTKVWSPPALECLENEILIDTLDTRQFNVNKGWRGGGGVGAETGTVRHQNDIMGLSSPVPAHWSRLSVLSSLKLKLSERAESMSAVSTESEPEQNQCQQNGGNWMEAWPIEWRTRGARTIYIQTLPDFKLIFKIQPFCVCSSDSGTKQPLCPFLFQL